MFVRFIPQLHNPLYPPEVEAWLYYHYVRLNELLRADMPVDEVPD